MKTIIHVYKQHIKNHNKDTENTLWGIGDCMRGTLTLYKLSKIMNFNLIVDIRHHPISNFIKIRKIDDKYLNYIDNNLEELKFYFYLENLKKFITNSLVNNDIVCIHTNAFIEEDNIYNTNNNITHDEQQFMKDIFIPNDSFKNYIDTKIINIPKKYNIIHFRLGDNICFDLEKLNDNDLNKYEDIFKRNYEENDILISDNKIFKDYIKSKYNITVFDNNIGHVGSTLDIELIKGTLFDFFIQSNSSKIKSYSVYEWISGFVHWNSKIYDIPIEIIK